MPREMIVPAGQGWAPKHFRMAPATKANGMIWLSGVVANQTEEGAEAMEAAMDVAFQTIGKTLEACGSSWDHVVEMTSYHMDLEGQMPTFMKVKDRHVTGPDFPAWTGVGTTALAVGTAIVEIKIVAIEA